MFKQFINQDYIVSLFRKNLTYRLMLQDNEGSQQSSDVFAVECTVNNLLQILKELKRLNRKDNNLRVIKWSNNNCEYSLNPYWPNTGVDKVWLSFASVDSDYVEKDFILSITFGDLQRLINFLTDIDEL